MSNEQSQFLDSRRFQTEEICRIYRVPLHLVQDLSNGTYNNVEHAGQDFVQHTILPWLCRWESAILRDLLTDDAGLSDSFVKFNVDGLMRGDSATRAAFYSTMTTLGVMSINECRRLENLDPIPDGDEHFVQLNMQPLGAAVKGMQPGSQVVPADPSPTPLSLTNGTKNRKSRQRPGQNKSKEPQQ
jgi:phage portal protein BeeE